MTAENPSPTPAPRKGPTVEDAAKRATTWTGAYTIAIAASAVSVVAANTGFASLGNGALAIDLFTLVAIVSSWVLLATWMMTVRDALIRLGHPAPPAWKIWASWLIPIYAWFGPFQAMRQLSSRAGDFGTIRARWWASFIFANLMWFQASLFPNSALAVIGVTFAAVSMTASYFALRTIIARTTASVAGA